MSTKVVDRKPSPIQFLASTRDLVSMTWSNMKKCPKNSRFIYQTKICDIVETAYMHLITADSIKVKTENDKVQRRGHLFEALGLINTLEALLSIVQQNLEGERNTSGKRYITMNTWNVWGAKINEVRKLILGLINRENGDVL